MMSHLDLTGFYMHYTYYFSSLSIQQMINIRDIRDDSRLIDKALTSTFKEHCFMISQRSNRNTSGEMKIWYARDNTKKNI